MKGIPATTGSGNVYKLEKGKYAVDVKGTVYVKKKQKTATSKPHTVEGLLLALADIDKIIQTIRESRTQIEAKQRLMGIECPAAMMQRARS